MISSACPQQAVRQQRALAHQPGPTRNRHAACQPRLDCRASTSGRPSSAGLADVFPEASTSEPLVIERADFRPNVGICVVNRHGLVFAARRLDDPTSWQLPQGGIDEGEEPVAAALRELWEETNIRSVEVVTCMPKWVHYCFSTVCKTSTPGIYHRYPGQRQKWYMLRFVGDESEIDLDANHREFSEWCWLPLQEIAANVVPFKRVAYQQMAAEFGPRIRQLVTKGTVGFGDVAASHTAACKKRRSPRTQAPAYMMRLLAQRHQLGLN